MAVEIQNPPLYPLAGDHYYSEYELSVQKCSVKNFGAKIYFFGAKLNILSLVTNLIGVSIILKMLLVVEGIYVSYHATVPLKIIGCVVGRQSVRSFHLNANSNTHLLEINQLMHS